MMSPGGTFGRALWQLMLCRKERRFQDFKSRYRAELIAQQLPVAVPSIEPTRNGLGQMAEKASLMTGFLDPAADEQSANK